MPSSDFDLTSLLKAPPSFLNVTSGHEPGRYLFGYPDFRVRDVRVAGLLHRSFAGAQEDLVLGVISVMLIALLSEIVQTIFMRTRRTARVDQVSQAGLNAAFMIDEASHFRNVWGLIRRDDETRGNSRRRKVAINSLVIVLIAVLLLAAEVLAVYLTQPFRVYTTKYQYNLRGLQPAGTSRETAIEVDLLISKKRCITPSMMNSNQSREYTLNACVMRAYETQLDGQDDFATFVEVESWYHEAGSDHVVTFGNEERKGRHNIFMRANILQGQSGVSKGVLFELKDGKEKENAKYLQMYMIYTAMQWNCEQEWEDRSCMDIKNEMTIDGDPITVKREILLWEKKEQTIKEIEGIKTRLKIRLRQPFMAIQNALHVFTTSAVIEEVEGPGMYVDMSKNEIEDGVESLVSEEGRIAGVVLLSVIFAALLILLIALRCCLKPVSLARMARDAMEDDMDLEMQGVQFVGTGRHLSGEYPLRSPGSQVNSDIPRPLTKALSLKLPGKGNGKARVTDLNGSVADDYESTITFEGVSSDSSNMER